MNSTTQPPPVIDGDVAVSYVLVPFFLITIIGIAAAVVSCWTGFALDDSQKVGLSIKMIDSLICSLHFTQNNILSPAGHVYPKEKEVRLNLDWFHGAVKSWTWLSFCFIPFTLTHRIDRLRHQLLPVYTYDPSEELNEAEQEMLWREEDTRVWCTTDFQVFVSTCEKGSCYKSCYKSHGHGKVIT